MTPIKEHRSGEWSPGLAESERETVFALAADTLKWCVEGSRGAFPFANYALTERLQEPVATFVTLKIREQLRGCIGCLAPEAALYRSVHDNAINAALHDYRFRPVSSRELPLIEVDVSLLSPIRPIATLDEFHIGAHGIIIEKGSRRAVYLPEVAVEQGWTREEALTSLSEKAGLPPDAWREGARFKVFSSVVLSR
jgi:AmmeMemoRadiSam system protein A